MASSYPDSDIQLMFDKLAARYNLFNRLTSFGQDAKWRRIATESIKQEMRVLDLGCGTGDLSIEAKKRTGPRGEVVGLDFSEKMIEIAKRRCPEAIFLGHRAEELPLAISPFDRVVSGFVLRNIHQNLDRILKGVYDSLKIRGEISFLDFAEPQNPLIRFLWKVYMHSFVALYGWILFGKNYPRYYMTDSAARFMKPVEFVKKLDSIGFREIQAKFFLFGIIVLYKAAK